MLEEKVLYVLTRCVEAGYAEAMNQAVAPFDPLERALVRRRARAAILRAGAGTSVPSEGAGELHHLRLAFLDVAFRGGRVARKPETGAEGDSETLRAARVVDRNDVDAVAGSYALLAKRYPMRRSAPWYLSGVLALVVLAAGAVGIFLFFWPTPEDRFMGSSFGEALGEPLTDFVGAVARQRSEDAEKTKRRLLSGGVRRQLGDEAFKQLELVLARTSDLARAQTDDEANEANQRLDETVARLNTKLAARHVPACIDTYVVPRQRSARAIWLLGYYAEEQALVSLEGKPQRVFWGRRVDNLNLEVGSTAYKSGAIDSIIVTLDELEEDILLHLAATLAPGRDLQMTDDAAEGSALARMQARAGELVREELTRAGDLSDVDAAALGDLVAKRRAAFERLRFKYEGLGMPRVIVLPKRFEQRLAAMSGDVDAKEAARTNDRLKEYVRPFRRIVSAMAALEEEQFVGYIFERERLGNVDDAPARAAEGARLALLARKPALPGAALARIATDALGGRSITGPASLAIFEALGKELGVAFPSELDRESFAELYLAVTARPVADLRAAAERAYARRMGVPVPRIERKSLARN